MTSNYSPERQNFTALIALAASKQRRRNGITRRHDVVTDSLA